MVSRFAGAAWVPLCLGLAGATLINVHQQPQTVFFAEWALALGLLLAFAMTALGRLDGLELRLGLMPWLVGLLAAVCVGRLVSEAPAGLGLGYPLYLGLFGLAYLLGAQLRGQGVVVAAAIGMLACALLQSLAELAEWRAAGDVEFLGQRSDVLALNQSASVVVLASRQGEGIPRALLEGAACAVPLVATDVPGCREVVMAGETGLLVPPAEPARLAAALLELLGDEALRGRLGAAARAHVAKHFSDEVVIAQTCAVYARALGEEGACC